MMDRFILWDLDGTVVESEKIGFKEKMFAHASEKLNLVFNLSPDQYIGHEAKSIFKKILIRNQIKDEALYMNTYTYWYEEAVNFIKKNVSLVPPRENVTQLWKEAIDNGIINAIVTSSREDVAKEYLKNIGLIDFCAHLTCINHVLEPKPSPAPYLRAMSHLGGNSSNCIVIEDSKSGVLSAKSANLYTIAWISKKNGLINKIDGADRMVTKLSFNLIKKAFESINKS